MKIKREKGRMTWWWGRWMATASAALTECCEYCKILIREPYSKYIRNRIKVLTECYEYISTHVKA